MRYYLHRRFGTVLNSVNDTIIITAEDGITIKTYKVVINVGAPSNIKQILTFGFNRNSNIGWGFTWPDSTYAGIIDQTLKRISVVVPYNTNLYQLRAYFTKTLYSCVSIAESNGTFTSQTSELNINNYANTLTYVVTTEDGTQERYEVIVTKTPAKTGNELIDFQLTLTDCFSTRYIIPGIYTDTNIAVSVKYGTNLSTLFSSFTVSEGATANMSAGIINFTNPVNIIVTSQAGIAKTYTVTIIARPENREKKLLSFGFDSDHNLSLNSDIVGSINEITKTVELFVPRATDINNLKASFTVSNGAVMMHNSILQINGVTVNDFITPVVYTVWAENCSYIEYFVIATFGTGINDIALENKFNVYPNPANDRFTVSIDNIKSIDMTLQLVNISGQIVYRNELKNIQTQNVEINSRNFAKGIYYLRVNDEAGVKVTKVIIQ